MGISSFLTKAAIKRISKTCWGHDLLVPKDIWKVTPEELREMARELPHESGVSAQHIEGLIGAAHKTEISYIIPYLKSQAATNLTKWERAQLIHQAIEKLDLLNLMSHLM